MLVVTPMQKPYFYSGRLPFFAPALPVKTNFMKLYKDLMADPRLHMVNVYGILSAIKDDYKIFYSQDFPGLRLLRSRSLKKWSTESPRLRVLAINGITP